MTTEKKIINLLKVSDRETSKSQRRLGKKIRTFLVVFLGIYCLSAIGLFSYWLFLKNRTEKLNDQLDQKTAIIASHQRAESLHLLLKQKLSALNDYTDQTLINYDEVLTDLNLLTSSEITLIDISLDQLGTIQAKGETSDVLALADFLENFNDSDGQFFETAILESLSRGDSGIYTFEVNLSQEE